MKKILMKIGIRVVFTTLTVLAAIAAYHIWMYTKATVGIDPTIFYGLMKATAGISVLRIVDDLVYIRIDTEELFKNNPIAYAIYILAYGVVIAGAFGV